MNLELKRAERMGDPLERVLERMCEIVHRVDAPLVAVAEVVDAADPVDDRVAHVDVRGGHVDAGAQDHRSVFEFTGFHAFEKREVLLDAAAAARGLPARRAQVAAVFVPFVGGEVADVGEAFPDQRHRALVHALEIIARIIEVFAEVEAEPLHVVDD